MQHQLRYETTLWTNAGSDHALSYPGSIYPAQTPVQIVRQGDDRVLVETTDGKMGWVWPDMLQPATYRPT